MKLNLREIIEIPGGKVPFAQTLDTQWLDFPSVKAYTAPITAEGEVINTAGILTLQGTVSSLCCPVSEDRAEKPILPLSSLFRPLHLVFVLRDSC